MRTESENRIFELDNLKCFLIFMVVLGHAADLYADTNRVTGVIRFIIYTFHMPLFIFISGMLGKKNIRERRINNILSYLVLYLFIKVFQFIILWIVRGTAPAFRMFSDASAPWYIFALFAFSFITMAVDRVSPKYVLIFSVIVGCLAGYDSSLGDKFCLMRIFVFFPFYYAGYLTDPVKLCGYLSKKKFIPAAAAVLAALIIITAVFYDDIYLIKFIFTGRNAYSDVYENCWYGFLLRLLCYAVSSIVGLSLIAIVPNRNLGRLFTYLGANTVQIYALHLPIVKAAAEITENLTNVSGRPTYFYLILVFSFTVLIFAFCAIPLWGMVIRKIMHIPLKNEE